MDYNSQMEPEKITPYNEVKTKKENEILKTLLPKTSWNVIRIKIKNN